MWTGKLCYTERNAQYELDICIQFWKKIQPFHKLIGATNLIKLIATNQLFS